MRPDFFMLHSLDSRPKRETSPSLYFSYLFFLIIFKKWNGVKKARSAAQTRNALVPDVSSGADSVDSGLATCTRFRICLQRFLSSLIPILPQTIETEKQIEIRKGLKTDRQTNHSFSLFFLFPMFILFFQPGGRTNWISADSFRYWTQPTSVSCKCVCVRVCARVVSFCLFSFFFFFGLILFRLFFPPSSFVTTHDILRTTWTIAENDLERGKFFFSLSDHFIFWGCQLW